MLASCGGAVVLKYSNAYHYNASSSLNNSTSQATCTKNAAITANSPTSSGDVVVPMLSPLLTGKPCAQYQHQCYQRHPTAITAASSYTVTAINSGGSAAANVSITVYVGVSTDTCSLATARESAIATLLPNDKALIAAEFQSR
jgi:hypothetical protein